MTKKKQTTNKQNRIQGFDYIGVGVSFIIHDGKGKILLQKRSKNARDEHGRWDNGGGAIEFGENFEETLKREIQEEFGVEPDSYQFLDVYDAHRIINDLPTHWVQVIYGVLVDPKKVKIGEPHKVDEIGWFNKDNLPSPRHSMFHKAEKLALDHNLLK